LQGKEDGGLLNLAQLHEVPIVVLNVDDMLSRRVCCFREYPERGLNALEEANGFELLNEQVQLHPR
jgi:hypothetical protein